MKSYLKFSRAIFAVAALCLSAKSSISQTPFWSNNGNSVGANDKLGSTNNAALTFVTNNTQRMQISAAGNVGIGTSPSSLYRLDVNGDANFSGTVHAFGLVLATKAQIDTVRVTNIMSLGNNFNFVGGALNEMYTASGDLRIQSLSGYNGNVVIGAGTSGNVGVGIYSPQYKLDVSGDQRISGQLLIHRIIPLPGDSEIHFGDSSIIITPNRNVISASAAYDAANGIYYRGLGVGFGVVHPIGSRSVCIGNKVGTDVNATNAVILGLGPNNGPLWNNTIPNSLMIGFNCTIPTIFVSQGSGVGTTGAVCIGGTYIPPANSNIKLAVKGNIEAEDLKVQLFSNWPDYVFESGYDLMNIDSLAEYVNANKHLPDSKPAVDVEQNGMSVSETANSQQKEIEQLTLYILQLNERMKALEAENADLKASVNH